jgi:hypothetical protein
VYSTDICGDDIVAERYPSCQRSIPSSAKTAWLFKFRSVEVVAYRGGSDLLGTW